MKNRFSFFIKGRNNKAGQHYGSNDLNSSSESDELGSGFDSFVIHKCNNEIADDAISIRSSVDCTNSGLTKSIKRLFSKYSKAAMPLKSSGLSQSHQHLNVPKETKMHIDRGQMKYRNCNGDMRYKPHDLLSKTIPEDCKEYPFAIPQNPVIKRLSSKSEQPSKYGVTTAAIMSRHASTSSMHSNTPWIETEQGKKAAINLSKEECDRQNAIHELITGELSLLNDLKNAVTNYKRPMENLNYLTESESFNIFYTIDNILEIYENIVSCYENEIDERGIIKSIGKCLIYSCNELKPVINYCTHLYFSKSILEEKRKCLKVSEFLKNCSTTRFSRKLDLWDFLDKPRSRLMKYPLLIDRILKSTPTSCSDHKDLLESKLCYEKLLINLDEKTGEEMCNFYLDKIAFPEENQYVKLVKAQKVLYIEGSIKVGRSVNRQKVHAFLFKDVLVFTKQKIDETNDGIRYIVYGNPLPTMRLVLEDIDDGEIKVGSFRSTFISDRGSKNVFRLTLLSDFLPESEFTSAKTNPICSKLTNHLMMKPSSNKALNVTDPSSPSSSSSSSPLPPNTFSNLLVSSDDNLSPPPPNGSSEPAVLLQINNHDNGGGIGVGGGSVCNETRVLTTPSDFYCDLSVSSHDYRLLKNSQTIIQVEKCEEKQLWLQYLRKLVAREIKKQNTIR